MDFSKLNTVKASENTYRFEVTHPITGEGAGAMIDVYASQSDVVQRFQSNVLRKLQKQEFENQRTRKPQFKELSELKSEALENAIVRVASWENLEWEGTPLEFTPANVKMLLTQCPWLAEQIIEQSEDLGNFLKA